MDPRQFYVRQGGRWHKDRAGCGERAIQRRISHLVRSRGFLFLWAANPSSRGTGWAVAGHGGTSRPPAVADEELRGTEPTFLQVQHVSTIDRFSGTASTLPTKCWRKNGFAGLTPTSRCNYCWVQKRDLLSCDYAFGHVFPLIVFIFFSFFLLFFSSVISCNFVMYLTFFLLAEAKNLSFLYHGTCFLVFSLLFIYLWLFFTL